MGRSFAAILVGFVFIGTLSFGADAVLRAALPGAFDAAGRAEGVAVLLLIQAYVGVAAIAGCWLTARLAPSAPMRHALILGGLGLAFNVAGSIVMWDTAPAWFHVVAIALVMPYAWAGGRLRELQLEREGGRGALAGG
jgi:hypothetical protein